jgi:hypothetical protein
MLILFKEQNSHNIPTVENLQISLTVESLQETFL